MFWSSMFRTEMPMTSGRKSWTEFLMPNVGSPSNIRLSKATSLPAFRVAAATQASPRGSVGIFIVSVFAEISRTLTNSPRPPVVPSVVPDFHFGIPPGYECTPYSLEHEAVRAFDQLAHQHIIVRSRTGPWPLKRPAELPVKLIPPCGRSIAAVHSGPLSPKTTADPPRRVRPDKSGLRMTDDFKLRICANGGMQSALPRHAKLLRTITSFQARVRATVQRRSRILFEPRP